MLQEENYARTDFVLCAPGAIRLRMPVDQQIRDILRLPDWTQMRVANTIGVTQSTVHRWLRGSEPEGHHRDAVKALHDKLFGGLIDAPTVPLKGRVGAGALVEAYDAEDYEPVVAPNDYRPTTVAVEVWGESMLPAYENGTILYYSRLLPPAELANKRCVVQLADGRIFVKILRRGSTPRTWNLQSLNPAFQEMEDQVVEWAAPIDWIKPRP